MNTMSNMEEHSVDLKKLHNIEKMFNFLVSNVCDMFFVVNVRTGEIKITRKPDEVVPHALYKDQIEWIENNSILPEDRKTYREEFKLENIVAKLRINDNFYTTTYTVNTKNGIRILLLVNALMCDSFDSKEEYVISYSQDITELKYHKEQNKKLIDISLHDTVTGIYNRHAAEKIIQEYLENDNTSEPGCLLVIDIDHFKNVNDTYGHSVGDQVLRFLAQSMRDIFRSEDTICRWGGDEFVVFMRNVSAQMTISGRIERLRLRMLSFKTEQQRMPVTLSIGSIIVQKKCALNTLFKKADILLYRVKNSGRDGFIISTLDEV